MMDRGKFMKRWIAGLLVLVVVVSFSGCKKDTLTTEQKIANLEKSNQQLEEAARRAKENYESVKQQNQEYLDAYAKASGGR